MWLASDGGQFCTNQQQYSTDFKQKQQYEFREFSEQLFYAPESVESVEGTILFEVR